MISLIPTKTVTNRYYIKFGEEICGILDLIQHEETTHIQYIKIYEEYRRRKIATQVVDLIRNTNQDKYIHGDVLPTSEAINFWKSIGVEFDEVIDDSATTPFHLI